MKHIDDLPATGRRIKRRREQLGMSQRDLSFEGCSYAYISRIEAGARQPTLQLLEELAARLKTTVRYLTTGEQEPVEIGLEEGGLAFDELDQDERRELQVRINGATMVAARDYARYALEERETRRIHELEQELEESRRRQTARVT